MCESDSSDGGGGDNDSGGGGGDSEGGAGGNSDNDDDSDVDNDGECFVNDTMRDIMRAEADQRNRRQCVSDTMREIMVQDVTVRGRRKRGISRMHDRHSWIWTERMGGGWDIAYRSYDGDETPWLAVQESEVLHSLGLKGWGLYICGETI